ncbi:hypothetical protein HMN09_00168400 [Mycena chlorophos]|uniref:F-box domain-containing protein n=1 Tax=Mycena chlorophos TaxID=658473 RepID=A0A8H6WJF0_MYCCL|nr:hypothetical protein HMN09_00168400 [Mycena chlorophos]
MTRPATRSQRKSLLSLTDELLLEIVSCIQDPPPAVSLRVFFDRRDGQQTLLALARTCGRLRKLLLKLAMEDVWVACSRQERTRTGKRRAKEPAMTLLNPDAAPYVRSATIETLSERMVPELARCLSSYLALHTLQVVDVAPKHPQDKHPPTPCPHLVSPDRIAALLEDQTFSAIRTLNIHFRAFSLVRSCPNVEHLGVYGDWSEVSRPDGLRLEVIVSDLKNHAKKLKVFRCNFFRFFPRSVGVLKFFPNLEEIPAIDVQQVTPDLIHELDVMPNLCRIAFRQGPWMGQHQLGLGTMQLVATAKDVLRRTALDVPLEKKCVLVDVGEENDGRDEEEVPPIVFEVDAVVEDHQACDGVEGKGWDACEGSSEWCATCLESETGWTRE